MKLCGDIKSVYRLLLIEEKSKCGFFVANKVDGDIKAFYLCIR